MTIIEAIAMVTLIFALVSVPILLASALSESVEGMTVSCWIYKYRVFVVPITISSTFTFFGCLVYVETKLEN